MAKTREEREEEERQRQEELAVFGGGRSLRRSIAVLDNQGTTTGSNNSSLSTTSLSPLPTFEEVTEQLYTSRSKGKQPKSLNSARITRLVRIGNNNSLGGNGCTLLPDNMKLKGDVNYNT